MAVQHTKETTETIARMMKRELDSITKKHLNIDTLEERKADSLDFHEVSVWSLQDALEAAFKLGQQNS